MSKVKHSPTPWKIDDGYLLDTNGFIVVQIDDEVREEAEQKANEAFIVTACNSHEELVEALKVLAKHFIRESQNALGPGHLFCDMCGRNSDTDTHFDDCPVLKAEQALAKAGRP